jgi:hypothetical protein
VLGKLFFASLPATPDGPGNRRQIGNLAGLAKLLSAFLLPDLASYLE